MRALLVSLAVLLSGCTHQSQPAYVSYKDLPPASKEVVVPHTYNLASLKQSIPVYTGSCACPSDKSLTAGSVEQ